MQPTPFYNIIFAPKYWKILFLCTLGIILWLATSERPPELTGNLWDKGNHFMAFAILTIMMWLAEETPKRFRRISGLMGYGLLIEIVQSFLPYRSASALDLMADAVGIGAGECGILILVRLLGIST